jgi:ubiquinone/menaquinone biosynthesis C-methylase UbiE
MSRPVEQQAALDFVLALRQQWASKLYPHVRRQLEDSHQSGPDTPERLAAQVHALPSYRWFAWLERGSQKMLWRAVSAAVACEPASEGTRASQSSTLELDPSLHLPDWYTEWDIHLQPGGVWSSDTAARVYELGAKLVMLGENDDYLFHRLFASTALPARKYRRIVDLGCGFGKSTWVLKKTFPEADVIGVDLAASCLRLAAQRADEQRLQIRFKQADAAATGLGTGSVDLVTSTMLAHELPLSVLPGLFSECARLLAPGGVLRFLDFQYTGDAFRDLAMLEHGQRNNEPYMPPMMAADLTAMARAAGLGGARWTAFDERAAGRLEQLRWPARTEWHFPWAVFEAEKPA